MGFLTQSLKVYSKQQLRLQLHPVCARLHTHAADIWRYFGSQQPMGETEKEKEEKLETTAHLQVKNYSA